MVQRRAPCCVVGHPDVGLLVWSRAPWCGGERPGVEDIALVWRTAPWCGGERPDVKESTHPGVE